MAGRLTLDFLKTETGSGLALAVAAAAAVLAANSPWSPAYFGFIHAPVSLRVGDFEETLSVLEWIKQGLMTIFFLVVGMEIKFEALRGELSSPRRLALPVLAAIGGMIVPAAVYLAFNRAPGGAPQGWPVPVATDIAFALAALAVAAPRLPASLRIFLLALAIADDLGAVALIAVVFTSQVNLAALAGAGSTLAVLAALGRWKRAPLLLYAVGFLIVWAFTLRSGINTSLAGVACAFTAPIGARRADQPSVLSVFMDGLHPYVAFGVLPLFAFAAAGFSFKGMGPGHLLTPMPLGIALALLIGKPVGIVIFSAAAIAIRVARRPSGSTWLELLGVAMLCGAGFTMSLYIGALAFGAADAAAQGDVRLGVIAGSLASAIAGGLLLAWRQAHRDRSGETRLDL
jgi:Na+:H+ antiporter, NhaA family